MSIRAASSHVPRSKDTRSRARTSNTPNVHSRRQSHVRSSQGHPCSRAYFKHSKCPFGGNRTSLVPRTPVLVRVLQTLQMSIRRHTARLLVPRTPVLARVLQTLQVSIQAASARPSSQGHPFSCAYFKHSKCPLGGIIARLASQGHPARARTQTSKCPFQAAQARPSSKDTRSRARTSNTPNVHSGGIMARILVPRTPVLVRVLQTLQMSTIGGTAHVSRPKHLLVAYFKHSKCPRAASRTSSRSKDTRSRARTSNSPDFHSWRQARTSTRPTAPRARARTSNILNPECAQPACTPPHVLFERISPCHSKLAHRRQPRTNRRRRVSNLVKTTPPHPSHRPGRARVHG